MKRLATIAVLYTIFAIVATVANLASQAAVISFYAGFAAIEVSIVVGTAVGLTIKYVLDKRYIFEFSAVDFAHDSKLFVLYSFMGVFTTALFWCVEYGFDWLFGTDLMRYVGGAIGLTAGYAIKYRLDKRFVFVAGLPGPAQAA